MSQEPAQRDPLVLVSNRGPVTFHAGGEVQRGSGGLVTALTGLASHRDAIWIASAMSEHDAEASRAAGGRRVPGRLAGGGRIPSAAGRLRRGGLRPLLQRLRQPDAVVHPALPVGPVQRAGHPPRGDRGVRVRLQRRQRGSRPRGRRGARGRGRAGRDGPRLPPLHAPRPRAQRAPGCLPAPLHPHPLDAVRRLAGAADADPRGDLRGPAGERHRRLSHPLLPAQLPAVLPRSDGPRGRLRARDRAGTGARGVGARLPAADRPRGHAASSRSARAWRSSRPS